MKTLILILGTCVLSALATQTNAQDAFGVGVIIGEPTGIVIKKWIGADTAFDVAAAWSFSENASFQLHGDYLIHNFSLLDRDDLKGNLPVYYGIGGRIKLKENNAGRGRNDEDTLIGVRVPLGISYLFADAPVDIFFEIAPLLDLIPDTEFSVNSAIGARYYFR